MTCVTLEGNDQLEVGFRPTVLFHILVSVTVVILLNKIHWAVNLTLKHFCVEYNTLIKSLLKILTDEHFM